MPVRDLREAIRRLQDKGYVMTVEQAVDPRFEVARYQMAHNQGPALFFKKVKRTNLRMVSGIFGRREYVALCLETSPAALREKLLNAAEHPLSPSTVTLRSAPVQERTLMQPNLLTDLPIPVHFENDAGPYITSGIILARDPERCVRNVSFARLQVAGPTRLRVMVNEWRHLLSFYRKAQQRGKSLEVAIIIGPPPSLWLQGAVPDGLAPETRDELDMAASLQGEPIPVVRCRTVALEVPAQSEIVLEGEMLPDVQEEEGPFADYPGVYDMPPRPNPVIEVRAITMRNDAIYQDVLPGSYENWLLGGIPREADLLARIAKSVPTVKDVHLTPGGAGRFHLVVKIEKKNAYDPYHAILAALYPTESSRDIKLVIVVDEDIDIFDPVSVEWALATRVQWDRDVQLFRNLGCALDPSAIWGTPAHLRGRSEALTAKIGIDATIPFGEEDLRPYFRRATVPGYHTCDNAGGAIVNGTQDPQSRHE